MRVFNSILTFLEPQIQSVLPLLERLALFEEDDAEKDGREHNQIGNQADANLDRTNTVQ